jgi:RHS repeat-associated protein
MTMTLVRSVAVALAAALAVTTLGAAPPAAAGGKGYVAPAVPAPRSVPGTVAVPLRLPAPATPAWTASATVWPKADRVTATDATVEIADRARTAAAGLDGLLLKVTPAALTGRRPVTLTVDYRDFRYAYGADWAERLRLVRMPSCALTAPQDDSCRTVTPIASRNDRTAGTVSASVASVAAEGEVFALTAGASGNTGDFRATPLSPSASWQVSPNTGDFTWSYAMRTPPVAGDLAPELELSYSAGSVDGRIANTNNQASWVGEGFFFGPGFVERRYRSCIDDGVTPKTGDLCWGGEYDTLVLDGHASELIRDDATGKFRLREDDGTRVERLTGAVNGAQGGEHWRVTTTDGTQYYFGRNQLPGYAAGKPVTGSTWTVPVFGDDAGEPCHQATYDASWCQQAWRWNLDEVVDAHGNVMTYYYQPETNYYGRNVTASKGTAYTRGGFLLRTEYGLRSGGEYATPPARVVYAATERCLPDSTFDCAAAKLTASTASRWPDVPFDQDCTAGAACTGKYSPTFWSRKRLTDVTTQVLNGTTFRNVDKWTLRQSFPAPGDGTTPALWLAGITHAGLVGTAVTVPEVTFDARQLTNRVDALEGLAPMVKYRIGAVRNETGGVLTVNYSAEQCDRATTMPSAPESNGLRCFPAYWVPEGSIDPTLDWFHKYVVTSTVDADTTGGNPFDVTTYSYEGTPAWHYDDQDLVPASRRTWSSWRGYQRVRVIHGDTSEQRSETEHLYFRGMDGDKLPSGTRSATVTDSEGGVVADHWRLSGRERETIVHNGPGGAVVEAEIADQWLSAVTATQGARTAMMSDVAAVRGRVALASGGLRRTETRTTFDPTYGVPTQIDDLGDTATATDDLCTRYTYARNVGAWLIDPVNRSEVVAKACSATVSRPADLVSDVRSTYDGAAAYTTAATKGDITRMEEISGWSSGPVYAVSGRATYDVHGRVTDAYDAAGKRTGTAYTPLTGGPVTKVVTTNPLGHVETTTLEPAWGLATSTVDANGRTTDQLHDGLGRLDAVWLPGRAKATQTASLDYAYLVRTNGPVAVTTRTLRNDGAYNTSQELYDSLLRPRQTQRPAPGGGRVVSDTRYNTRGLVAQTNHEFYNTSAVDTNLFLAADNVVPGQTVTTYDGADRPTVAAFRVLGVEKWRTTTAYGGDRVDVDPPDGQTATTTITDARDRTVELRQYKGGSPTGLYDATKYTYWPTGQQATVTDAAGNVWKDEYDIAGRRIKAQAPDTGTTLYGYDAMDRLTSLTDARGKNLTYTYDDLGRRTAVREGTATLASWTYDTVAKGRLTSSTRFVGAAAYTSAFTGYDPQYRPTGTSVTIPAAEGALAGTYTTTMSYNLDGTTATRTLPAAGTLPSETLTYGYDELGGVKTLTSPLTTYINTTTPAKLGMLQERRYGITGKRVIRNYTYEEGTNRLVRAFTDLELLPAVRQADVAYGYDAAGNVTKIADTPPAANAPSQVQCLRYDYLRRLTDAWTATDGCAAAPSTAVVGGAAPYWSTYGYDLTGNRTSEVQHGASGDTTRVYAYPAAGQAQPHTVRSVAQSGPAGARTDTYGYDAMGNTTARTVNGAGQVLDWTSEGYLASVTQGSAVTAYLYDANGERLLRRDPSAVTLTIGATEVRLDKATGIVRATRYYTDETGTVAVRTYDNRLTWTLGDQHQTAELAIDATSLTVRHRYLTPFGTPVGTAVPWTGERGFVNGTMDVFTGLTQLGARLYDPALGRFLSSDPVVDMRDPQQLNGYSYAGSNPATFEDADGLLFNCGPDGFRCGMAPHYSRTGHYTPPKPAPKPVYHSPWPGFDNFQPKRHYVSWDELVRSTAPTRRVDRRYYHQPDGGYRPAPRPKTRHKAKEDVGGLAADEVGVGSDLLHTIGEREKKHPSKPARRKLLGKIGQDQRVSGLGPASTIVGAIFDYEQYHSQGDSWGKALAKTAYVNGAETVGNIAGGATGILCGPLVVACGPLLSLAFGKGLRAAAEHSFNPPGPIKDARDMPAMVGP